MAVDEVARAEVILNGKKANATLKELENAAKALNAELRKLPTNSDEFVKKTQEYQVVKKRLGDIKQEIIGTQSAMSKIADWSNKYFQAITMFAAAGTGFVLAIKGMVSNAADLSDSLANIRKTTGMTADEVNRLNSELKKIDTRTSREELRQIANVAGQLGIEKNSILPFVDAIDKLNVALGDEILGGAQEVATSMGTLRNILTDLKSGDISDDMLRIGNAINDLGAAGMATAPVLVDFANRIGGVGINLGLSSAQVIGLSATMQELGIHVERGGTAMVKILSKMTTNTDQFAQVAGIPLKEFTQLVNTNLYGAFIKVLEGSRRAGEGATILGNMIKEMEISGIGASEVFSKLGANTNMLAEKVTMSGNSLAVTSGIMSEFNIKNETLGATINKLGKEFNSLLSSKTVTDMLKGVISVLVEFIAWLKGVPRLIKDNVVAFTLLAGSVLIYVAAITRTAQITLVNHLLLKEGILLRIKDAAVLEMLIIKEKLMTIAKSEGTIASKLATLATIAWNTALKANPIGLVIAGVTALIAAIKLYDANNKAALQNEAIKLSTMNRMESVNRLLAASYEEISNQVRRLNELSKQEKEDLKTKITDSIALAEVELAMMEQRQQKVRLDNSTATLWQKTGNLISSSSYGDMVSKNLADGYSNGARAAGELNESISKLRENLHKLRDKQYEVISVTEAESFADKIHGKSLDNLEEKMSKLQTARKNTIAGSEDYLRITKKIDAVQKELDKFDNSDPDKLGKKEHLTKLKTAFEKLNDQIKEYIELLQTQVLMDPKGAEATAKKIAALEKQKKIIEDLVALEIQRANYDDSQPISKVSSVGPMGKYPVSKKFSRKDKIDDVEANQPGLMGFESEDKTDTQIWAAKADKVLNYANFAIDTLSALNDSISSREDAQLQKDEDNNLKKQRNLKNRLNAGLITQKAYDAASLKMENELSAKRRKMEHDQAVRNKAIAVVQAGINVAQGITSALAGTPPASYVMAVLTGVLGAIQIAAILNSEVPQAAKGRYNVTGRDDGRSYFNVPYIGTSTTGLYKSPTLIAEAGPEFVIDAKTTRNLMMNYPGVIDAINFARVPQFAIGNYPSTVSDGFRAQANQSAFETSLLSALTEFNAHARSGIRSYMVYDDFRKTDNTVRSIESDVSKS